MAIVEGQKVRMLWRYSDAEHYILRGYPKLTKDEPFFVSVEDLKDTSKKKVLLKCDECGCEFYETYTLTRTRDGKHFCTDDCNIKYYSELDEKLLRALKRFSVMNHRSPKWIDFYYDKSYPNPQLYLIRFTKWNKALRRAGLTKIYRNDITKQELIREGKLFYREYKRSPSYKELSYDAHIISEMFSGWNNFLDECGIPHIQRKRLKWDKGYGKESIQDFYKKHKKIPSSKDLEIYGLHKNWILGTFGSIQNALIESGICTESDFVPSDEKVKNSLNFIRRFYQDNERPPTVAEYNHIARQKNDMLWRRNLSDRLKKTFTEICISVIGDDFNYNELTFGRYSVDKNGEFCRSYKEKMISDLLIDNNINFKKEVLYSNINPSITEGYRMDWYLEDYNIFVELFGIYNKNATKKDKIAYEYKLRTEAKIQLCDRNNINLISIFKRDNPEKIIRKFNDVGVPIRMTEDFKNL